MSRRVVGLTIAAIGAVVVFISAAADLIGISGGSSAEMFGNRQIIGTVLGALAIALGLVVALLPARQSRTRPQSAARTTQPIKRRKR